MFLFVLKSSIQLFGENDAFQQYGIPMNPTDNTQHVPELMDRQRDQNGATPSPTTIGATAAPPPQPQPAAAATAATTGSELISYQPSQTPIDFTDFLNLEEDQMNAMNASGSLENQTKQ